MASIGEIYAMIDRLKRNVARNVQDIPGSIEQGVSQLREDFNQDPVNTVLGSANISGLSGLLGTVVGPSSKTWNKVAADQFNRMTKRNFPADEAYAKTGTFDLGNGQAAQEISDVNVKTIFDIPSAQELKDVAGRWITTQDFVKEFPNTPQAQQIRVRNTMMQGKINDDTPRLIDALDAPEIFAAYPQLADIRVLIDNKMPIGDAAFSPKHNAIVLSPMSGKDAKETLLHEITHAIQEIENFPRGGAPQAMPQVLENIANRQIKEANQMIRDSRGGDILGPQNVIKPGLNKRGFERLKEARGLQGLATVAEMSPNAAFDAYQRLQGEAMARMVPRRSGLTTEQLRQNFPMRQGLLGLDMPPDQFIYRSLLD